MSSDGAGPNPGAGAVPGIKAFSRDGVGWIELQNAKKHNAISSSMWETMGEWLERFAEDDAVRCVVLSGEGDRAFCAGADLAEKDRLEGEAGEDPQELLAIAGLERLRAFSKPVIAKISGYCFGAGIALAIACDLRVAATGSSFSIPAAKLGLPYYYNGLKHLCDLVGPSHTKRIIFTADRLSTADALRIGLIDDMVAQAELDPVVEAMALRIATNAPLVLAAAKFAVQTILQDDAGRDFAGCQARELLCRTSQDHVEGRQAFQQRRPPVFRGV